MRRPALAAALLALSAAASAPAAQAESAATARHGGAQDRAGQDPAARETGTRGEAGERQGNGSLRGFAPETAVRQLGLERRLLDAISADSVARRARALAARPHVAGGPGQAATRDSVLRWHRADGLEARADSFVIYLPWPRRVSVSRLAPDPRRLSMLEDPLPGDPATQLDMFPAFNAYSGDGEATGEVVYANYGLPADYQWLDSLGVSVRGRVVVVRYGRSFRGIKAREAEARGAAALLMYSDPADDGYAVGDVYPEGRMRPAAAIQRGSILNAHGDPSTPGWPSGPDARRLAPDDMEGVARIPVAPFGYGAAAELLRDLGGPQVPEGWQGGLPFRYHLGPGPVIARVRVDVEEGSDANHTIYNTVGVLRGEQWADEWVVVGAHRDAWGPGAVDNMSGTSGVVEAARALAGLAARGWRPRRSILFVTWDAEEWGLIGSTEWVEARADELAGRAVAYLNQDGTVSGPDFGAAASPLLASLVRGAARAVKSPDGEGSVYARWLERARDRARSRAPIRPPDGPAEEDSDTGEEGAGAAESVGIDEPPVGDLGGGSDHAPFSEHIGIPAAGFGFGGPWGVYHSAYDTPEWMERFGDPGYVRHAAAARVLAVAASRLANADILPYDLPGTADRLAELAADLEADLVAEHGSDEAPADLRHALADLDSAIARFGREAAAFRSEATAALASGRMRPEVAKAVNDHLRRIGPSFTSERGVPGDPWIRQLLFASDPADGYATLALPSVRLALRAGDPSAVRGRVEELAAAVTRAAAEVEAARRALR